MPIGPGVQVGPYQVTALLGEGGMGQVYRATDQNLKRDVAIKVLSESMALDADRLARFQREGELLARLNHPNIAQIHGLEKTGNATALIMELVEGPTLADRITAGPIAMEEALAIAKEIASALEAAHEVGVIHRDLKPANVKVRPDGSVKVLDFGLAKAVEPSAAMSPGVSQSPTITTPAMTQIGMILGTAAYMAPEQARGRPVDTRADIWAFACVVYEMLTGRRLFQGEDVTETVAAVVREQPDFTRVPARVRRMLKACLEKDPRKRLKAIGDVWLLLDEDTQIATVQHSHRPRVAWGAAAAALVAPAGLSFVHFTERPTPADPVRFQITPPEGVSLTGGQTPSISPDGRRLAFVADGIDSPRRLWVQSLDSLQAQPLAGTEGALQPFWSPDSRSIAFSAPGRLLRVGAGGGPVQTVLQTDGAFGQPGSIGAWSGRRVILFAGRSGLSQVSEAGGAATAVTRVDESRGEFRHALPVFLPDGVHFLYLRGSSVAENSGIYVGSLDTAPEAQDLTRLLSADGGVSFVPADPALGAGNGRLLFVRDQVLMMQPFDDRRMALADAAVPVTAQAREAGPTFFSASMNGVLVYRPNRSGGASQLAWFNRDGQPVGTSITPGLIDVTLSPDGARVAGSSSDISMANRLAQFGGRRRGFFGLAPGAGGDIWLGELGRGIRTRFTSNAAEDGVPVWSPDGSRIAFASDRDGTSNLYERAASGAGEEQTLLTSDQHKWPNDWSPDGQWLVYSGLDARTNLDMWLLPMSRDGAASREPVVYLRTEFNESGGQLAPDGKWIAYESDATGTNEVYVQAFPKPAGAILVSSGGGREARWRADGRELYFLSPRGQLMAADVRTGPAFKVLGLPRQLFVAALLGGPSRQSSYDVAGNGQRFLINTSPDREVNRGSITVIVNWPSMLGK